MRNELPAKPRSGLAGAEATDQEGSVQRAGSAYRRARSEREEGTPPESGVDIAALTTASNLLSDDLMMGIDQLGRRTFIGESARVKSTHELDSLLGWNLPVRHEHVGGSGDEEGPGEP